jgi:adenylate kinase
MQIIVITGCPGSGKTTIARMLSRKLKANVLSLTDFIIKNKIFEYQNNEKVVDIKKLKKILEKEIKKISKKEKFLIVEGHLACDFSISYSAKVIVLRRSLNILKKEMEKRKYSLKKISDNLILEAFDYFGENSKKHYKNVFEIFVKGKTTTLKKILRIVKGEAIDETKLANSIEKKQLLYMLRKNQLQLL